MKLSDLRPCDACGLGLLQKPGGPRMATFYVVRYSQAMPMPAAGRVLAVANLMGGNLQLGEAMCDVNPSDAVQVFGDKNPEQMTELFVCFDCMPTNFFAAAEKRARQLEPAETL